eukprot:PhF_6_TR29263/c0_g1_i2/m.42862/K05692/ACTB_G1; actin beta/gamma 1
MPSCVGVSRNHGVCITTGTPDFYVGSAAVERRGVLGMHHPVKNGKVVDWDNMERLWSHLFYDEMHVSPEECCFLMTEAPGVADNRGKDKVMEVLFESFNVKGTYSTTTSSLALYSYGLTTGIVIESGLDCTSAIPVHEGYTLSRQVSKVDVGGDSLTKYLTHLLNTKGYTFSTENEIDVVQSMKESICYVADDFGEAVTAHKDVTFKYNLPDGQSIVMDVEKFKCPEVLFDFGMYDPSMEPKDEVRTDFGDIFEPSFPKGLPWLAYSAIHKLEPSLRKEMFNKIVLAGGNTLFSGLQSRVLTGIQRLYKEMHPGESSIPISVLETPCRQYSTWLGGSMLGMLSMFNNMVVTRKQYEEFGSFIAASKCF